MFYGILLFLHILVSIALVLSVLLQSSKGGGLAGTFGGSGITGGIFGGRGAAPFLVKATTFCAVLFMITSISLNFISPRGKSESVLERTLIKSGTTSSEPAVMNEMPVSTDTNNSEQRSDNSESEKEEKPAQPTNDNK